MTKPDPITVVVTFIEGINRGDVDALANLMADDYELKVFDEPAQQGKQRGIQDWRGYADAFPDYRIYPQTIAERDGEVAVLGCTTGSHLGLPDDEERELTLIWRARVRGNRLYTWHLVRDTPERRAEYGLDLAP